MILNKQQRHKKKIKKFLELINPIDKSNKERCRFKVQVSGVTLDDLDPTGPPREIPFSRELYKETENDAIELGKLEYANGNEVEIWKLVKRWS